MVVAQLSEVGGNSHKICEGVLCAVTRANERCGSTRPIRMLRFVHRIFWLCQSRVSLDPINRILLGSKFPEMVHGPIRPHISARAKCRPLAPLAITECARPPKTQV